LQEDRKRRLYFPPVEVKSGSGGVKIRRQRQSLIASRPRRQHSAFPFCYWTTNFIWILFRISYILIRRVLIHWSDTTCFYYQTTARRRIVLRRTTKVAPCFHFESIRDQAIIMRLLKRSSASSAVLSIVFATSFFSLTTYAAGGSSAADTGLPNLSTVTNGQSQSSSASSLGSQSSSASQVTITGSGIGASTTQIVPTITGGSSATDVPNLTGLPTLSKVGGQYSYPPASVPPTQNAPYMQVSNLPEGTVFIAVGAGLGFMAVCVLLWRGLVVWSLHRSVRRAAKNQDLADTKAMFSMPIAPTFKFSDRASTHSMSNLALGNSGKRGRPSTSGHVSVASQSLFYSPTAGVAGAGGLSHPGNRGSNYLPAGYYAAGASAPGNGAGMTHIGSASRENINLANLRPSSQGYTRAQSMGITPPDSPSSGYPPPMAHRLTPSMSTLELNPRTTAPRAPSAYLEDLFDEAGGTPGQHPHPHPHPHGGRY